ncbi:hypothetical protein A33Q_4281 [Indibacter alkaliphilus LW1]|uniref:Peptidase M14 domain-containing protein n=1 Tax=Indibacter alkaliphilus (strain CCUG 57479 / KCTC 22604 / LW1) TaxID=1189612 RepID=S2DQP0_INDAL|nr:M14 family metallopeptidase [Indibacter alkaliphilus]EOZ92188.1 hypothetical protein A33Q_4281 [Indibacter alkaliphilus LW1]
MKNIVSLKILLIFSLTAFAQQEYKTLFEESEGTKTPEYEEVIQYFQNLADDFDQVKVVEMGMTDAGYPLHLVLLDKTQVFDPQKWHEKNRPILFINNGIHPGEPDGIDASMMLLRDILLGKQQINDELVIALIPVYNIGGHLNRGSHSRVNQNGPEAYGFRGNARNFDLNRDFIKADTKNARSFQLIFNWVRPHIFVDTHVSNGADYQHVMTLISTQHNRLGGQAGQYLNEELNPFLYQKMDEKGFPMVPYVNAWGGKPEDGWTQFKDLGRYSSGYAALFGTLSFMPETHMLKPYKERVESTYKLLEAFLEILNKEGNKIVNVVKSDRESQRARSEFAFNHILDKEKHSLITFKGYESGQKPSDISGLPRLYYDRGKPFTKEVKFFDTYREGQLIKKPEAYIIPHGWYTVIENLQRNGVTLTRLPKDTTIKVSIYHIEDFQTATRPFEGHYLHSNTKIVKSQGFMDFRSGDYLVTMNQEVNRYIMEVLEPESEDSFFNWNFFDTVLQAKEGYSAYVFEDLANEFLEAHGRMRQVLEEEKAKDENLANSAAAQLRWVYERTPWKEKEHNRYPIFRID